jgi:hypothetical protein
MAKGMCHDFGSFGARDHRQNLAEITSEDHGFASEGSVVHPCDESEKLICCIDRLGWAHWRLVPNKQNGLP